MQDKKLKGTIRIPKDQYAFIEVECEGTQQELEEIYDSFNGGISLREELMSAEFRPIIYKYLTTVAMTEEEYNSLTFSQQQVIQLLKRSFKRIKA